MTRLAHYDAAVRRVKSISLLHRTPFAKYAAAFFMISFSRLSLAFSARKRDNSISSGVTTLLPETFNLPALAAFT